MEYRGECKQISKENIVVRVITISDCQ